MKKIISLLAASAVVLSSLTVAFAAPVAEEDKATPSIHGEFVAVDTDGTYQFDVTYDAGTTLKAMVSSKGKYTGTAINSFDASVYVDPEIWDVSDPDNMVFIDASNGVVPGATAAFNKMTNTIIFTWSSSAPNTYISAETGKLYTFWLTPKDSSLDGNTVPMSFTPALLQIETQKAGVITAQTEYSTLSSKHYDIAASFGAGTVAVESVTLDKSSVELDLNGTTTATLTATVTPDNATDKTVTWTTSDANVATVENGVVTAKKVGTATITAKAGEKSATCEVTVTDSTPVTPTMPTKGTVIVDAVDGKVVIYADSKDASAIATNAKFEIEYTGTNEALKRADGTYKKEIKRTFSEILGGEIGEGKVTGKVHFGIKIPDTVPEADRAFFTINVK